MADSDTDKVIAFLKEKWAGEKCPMCKHGIWNVQDSVFELREFHSGSMVLGGPIIPVVPVVCGNCGNTILINAIMSGAVEKPQEGNDG